MSILRAIYDTVVSPWPGTVHMWCERSARARQGAWLQSLNMYGPRWGTLHVVRGKARTRAAVADTSTRHTTRLQAGLVASTTMLRVSTLMSRIQLVHGHPLVRSPSACAWTMSVSMPVLWMVWRKYRGFRCAVIDLSHIAANPLKDACVCFALHL